MATVTGDDIERMTSALFIERDLRSRSSSKFWVLLVLAAIIASEVGRLTRGFKALTPAGLTQLINRDNALLIDVSSIQDYDQGHIPGARHVGMSQFDPESKDLAKAKALPVAVYCKNGQASSGAAKRLKKAGFSAVYTLDGGLRAWREAQLPVAKGRGAG